MNTLTARAAAATVRACHRSDASFVRRVRRRVERAVPRNTAGLTVSRAGIRVEIDLQDNLQRELFFRGDYERPLADLLRSRARPGDVFVDVGANIGLHSIRLATATSLSRVVAFEAAPDTADRLRRNLRLNCVEGIVEVAPTALGGREGSLPLRSSVRWGSGDLGVRSAFGDGDVVVDAPMTTFDAWWAAHGGGPVDLVKIDVEGAEFEVLTGMLETLRASTSPRLVVVEVVEDFLRRAGTSPASIDRFMADAGYRPSGPDAVTVAVGPTDDLWPNVLYERGDE